MRSVKVLPVLFLLASATTYGQFKKGSTLLGGDVSFYTNTQKDGSVTYKSNGVSFSPVVAKAVKENLFWGGSLSFSSSKNEQGVSYESNNQSYGAGVFVRRYKNILGKFSAFVQAGVNGSVNKDETVNQTPNNSYTTKGFSVGLNITPGISIGVSKKLFLETGFSNIAALNYSHSKQTGTSLSGPVNRTQSNFGFSSSLSAASNSLYFGFRFIL